MILNEDTECRDKMVKKRMENLIKELLYLSNITVALPLNTLKDDTTVPE